MERFRQIPNAITIHRFFLAFVIPLVYFWISPVGAFLLGLWAFASDWLDGFLARRYKQYGWQSKFGADFDPYADKFLHYGVLILLWQLGKGGGELWWPNFFILGYDVVVFLFRHVFGFKVPSSFLGKKKTAVLFVALGFLLLPPVDPWIDATVLQETWNMGIALLWVAAVLTLLTLLGYTGEVLRQVRARLSQVA